MFFSTLVCRKISQIVFANFRVIIFYRYGERGARILLFLIANSFVGLESPKTVDLQNLCFDFSNDSVKHIYFFKAHFKSVIDGAAECWPYFGSSKEIK